jgi:surface-anchored protein
MPQLSLPYRRNTTMTAVTTRAPRAHRILALGVAVAALAVAVTGPAVATEDPNLDQEIDAGQQVVSGDRVLDAGHVDVGPRFVDGEWTLLIHDDAAKADATAASVWRYPDETVLHVSDASVLQVPDDPAYAFLPVEPGEDVWVVPQTQNPDVVWVGWNTQDAAVMEAIDRGVTLALSGVQGPGDVVAYLQSGSFGEPEVLWDSTVIGDDTAEVTNAIWVDVNTHTHANWVFSEPGAYLVQLTISADLITGETVTDTRELRFAIGDDSSIDPAFAAVWDAGESDAAGEPVPAASDGAEAGDSRDPLVLVLIASIVLVALALIVGFTVAIVRSGRAKRLALDDRHGDRR